MVWINRHIRYCLVSSSRTEKTAAIKLSKRDILATLGLGIGDSPFARLYNAAFLGRHVAGNHLVFKHAEMESHW